MTPLSNISKEAREAAEKIDKHLWEHHNFMSSGTLEPFAEIIQSALDAQAKRYEEVVKAANEMYEIFHICERDDGCSTCRFKKALIELRSLNEQTK